MLDGVRHNEIVVGAYTDHGGICPMLAAHRAGGRTSCISFAKAWDAFAFRGARTRLARRATRRELLVLTSHLEASLLNEDGATSDLGAAIAEHDQLMRARPADDRPADTDASAELQSLPGWACLRVMRRYDEYERALASEPGRVTGACRRLDAQASLVETGAGDQAAGEPPPSPTLAPSR
jgi:hypothetical protein